MDDRVIQQCKRMGTTPPTGGVGRVTAMRCPGIAFVFIQSIKLAHILRKAYGFKGTHILATGKYISTGHFCVDLHHRSGNEFFFIQLVGGKLAAQRGYKITPDDRFVCDGRDLAGRYDLRFHDLKAFFQKNLAVFPGSSLIIEHVQRVKILILRINAVSCEAASQTVGSVMHRLHCINNLSAGHSFAIL